MQRRETQVANGRRQPIEFIKRGRVGSPKGNPVSCQVFTLRIFFFPEYVNMTQFMKKYMIQTLYMDAWDLGTFYIGDQLFLGVSQLGGKSFVIYKWDSEHRYAMIVVLLSIKSIRTEKLTLLKNERRPGHQFSTTAFGLDSLVELVYECHAYHLV